MKAREDDKKRLEITKKRREDLSSKAIDPLYVMLVALLQPTAALHAGRMNVRNSEANRKCLMHRRVDLRSLSLPIFNRSVEIRCEAAARPSHPSMPTDAYARNAIISCICGAADLSKPPL
jgi:hypothetical protein